MQRHDIQAITDFVQQKGLSEQTLSELRENYPGTHFTWCMDDDIHTGKPYREVEGFNIYLVDSRNHCANITSDESIASGLVFGECFEDD